jgi:glycosyltransferase involved in cell wall biosynthesis
MFVEYIDTPLPPDIRLRTTCISFQELYRLLLHSSEAQAAQLFLHSDWYIFVYAVNYSLLRCFWMIPQGYIIFDYHGVTPPTHLTLTDQIAILTESEQKTYIARFFDSIIVHSTYMREELLRHSRIAADCIQVLPLTVPQDEFYPEPRDETLMQRYGLDGNRVLLYVGRMAGNKRIPDMIQALAHVRRFFPNTVLLLVGDNVTHPYNHVAAEVRMLAVDLACEDHVIFTGRVSQSELPLFYRLCDIYLTASVHEGFCVPVIEAMACGKPVIVANATALPETVGDAGLMFHPGDPIDLANQIMRLFNEENRPLVAELSRRSMQRAAMFTREQYYTRMAEIFGPILRDTSV